MVEIQTIAFCRDPEELKRTVTHISWYPDGAHRLAAAYSSLEFQKCPQGMPLESYIWEVGMYLHVCITAFVTTLLSLLQRIQTNQNTSFIRPHRYSVLSTTPKIPICWLVGATTASWHSSTLGRDHRAWRSHPLKSATRILCTRSFFHPQKLVLTSTKYVYYSE